MPMWLGFSLLGHILQESRLLRSRDCQDYLFNEVALRSTHGSAEPDDDFVADLAEHLFVVYLEFLAVREGPLQFSVVIEAVHTYCHSLEIDA